MFFPERLKAGDKVAVISPASVVKPEYVDSAAEYIRECGFEPVVMPHAKGPADGSYAASLDERLSDIIAAWSMPDVKAVLCSRGGYGAVHLLPLIPENLFRENPRWLIGFSDISALHAYSLRQGVVSIHGPMAKDLHAGHTGGEAVVEILRTGKMPEYVFDDPGSDELPPNRPGEACGTLIGGNLAVLDGLAATPYDILAWPLKEDCILFIEDIAEPIYKIERILCRLYMQGVFSKLKGLAVGRFTETSPDRNDVSTEMMISRFLKDRNLTHFPVAYNLPVGHFPGNMPLIEGAEVCMAVASGSARLTRSTKIPF